MIGTYITCQLILTLKIGNLGYLTTRWRGLCRVALLEKATIPENSKRWIFVDCSEELDFIQRPNEHWKHPSKFWTLEGEDCELEI